MTNIDSNSVEIIEFIDNDENIQEFNYCKTFSNSKNINDNKETADLSITLIERRKRLHELATEINQWEEEASSKK